MGVQAIWLPSIGMVYGCYGASRDLRSVINRVAGPGAMFQISKNHPRPTWRFAKTGGYSRKHPFYFRIFWEIIH